ncbi:hypothetical protein EFK50_14565 [Nocardioides marmoriginsengisoli]|uniref:SHOCT domain-containing protein n=1 Tax=Nocardioides marmoriginsengisoli TaxID=661483 RepID=A0A3N0CHK9_9ACTN|nr:hypothetical protein [Nocardioides marmoriginsengisoli]RNL62944.1 hypothetical protein EFK50_14565 [Nocardioides marmoriginsengisoli]
MKLAILGVVATAIGVALSVPGLIGIGAFWVLLGPLMRQHAQRLKGIQAAAPEGKPKVDSKTFTQGTLLWLALGIPSLVVGLMKIGIDAEHENWRWLPLGIGIFALVIGVVGSVLYFAGSAALASGERRAAANKFPATLWISRVRETGSYINNRPRLEFVFRVEPDAGTGVEPYAVTKKATVPHTAMGSLKVGDGFRAKVAGPDDPTSMDITWDEPVSAAGADGGEAEDVSVRLDRLDQLHRDGKVSDTEYQEQRGRILGTL